MEIFPPTGKNFSFLVKAFTIFCIFAGDIIKFLTKNIEK